MAETDARPSRATGPAAAAGARRLLPEELARRIQERILSGELGPGAKLPPERELARSLGVNRSSLREALKKLEQLRLLTIRHGSGARVRPLEEASFEVVQSALGRGEAVDSAWVRDLGEVRAALLPLALRLALERGSAGERTQLVELLRLAADPLLGSGAFARAFAEIEGGLLRLSGNRALVMLMGSLGAPIEVPAPRRRVPLLRRLAVAFEAADAVTAQRILRDLLRQTGGRANGA
jgi:DNA-binding FadR family transcriptional regulator